MAIGIWSIMVGVMSLISIVGLFLLFMTKQISSKRILFYAMAVWGIMIAVLNVISLPENWITQKITAGLLGCVSLGGILIYKRAVTDRHQFIACILAGVSVIGGMMKLFV